MSLWRDSSTHYFSVPAHHRVDQVVRCFSGLPGVGEIDAFTSINSDESPFFYIRTQHPLSPTQEGFLEGIGAREMREPKEIHEALERQPLEAVTPHLLAVWSGEGLSVPSMGL